MQQPNNHEQSGKKVEKSHITPEESTEDFYFENGFMVMTAAFHRKRGFCCGNACRHCPYDHVNVTE